MTRTVALAGSEMADPSYVKTMYGAQLSSVLGSLLSRKSGVRLINGNPLTGVKTSLEDGFVGVRSSEVTAIPEGDNADEMLGLASCRAPTNSLLTAAISAGSSARRKNMFSMPV